MAEVRTVVVVDGDEADVGPAGFSSSGSWVLSSSPLSPFPTCLLAGENGGWINVFAMYARKVSLTCDEQFGRASSANQIR